MTALPDRRSIAMTEASPPVRRELVARPGGGGLAGGLVALACAGAFAALLLLDPRARDADVAPLWPAAGPIRTVAAAGPAVRPAAPAPETQPEIVTGSLGAAARPVTAAPAAFAADIGPAASLPGLRLAWAALRDRLAEDAGGLQPLIAVRETSRGYVLHLLVGPFANPAAAAHLCARLGGGGAGCTPAPFDGQRLFPAGSAALAHGAEP